MLTTHVDDLLYSYLPEAKEVMDSLLGSSELGSLEETNFRYCGKAFGEQNASLFFHTKDNTRTIKKIKVDNSQKLSDKLSPDQITKLRSVVGSLAWVARQGRPDLAYRVSYLQTAINGATVWTPARSRFGAQTTRRCRVSISKRSFEDDRLAQCWYHHSDRRFILLHVATRTCAPFG